MIADLHQAASLGDQIPLDDPFHNRHGKVAAGIDIIDAVIGRGPDRPMGW